MYDFLLSEGRSATKVGLLRYRGHSCASRWMGVDGHGDTGNDSGTQWILTAEEYAALPGYKRSGGEEEDSLRYQASGLVQSLGMRLKLPQVTIATAQVFLHRFYIREGFHAFPYAELAPAVLFLAAKVDEHPRKIRDVLAAQEQPVVGEDGRAAERLVLLEKIVLQTLCFDLGVVHPYRFVFRLVSGLPEVSDELVQDAWIVVNDSYRTSLCIRFPPKTLAAAAIVFAARRKGLELAGGDAPTAIFGCPREAIEGTTPREAIAGGRLFALHRLDIIRVLDDLYSGKFKRPAVAVAVAAAAPPLPEQ